MQSLDIFKNTFLMSSPDYIDNTFQKSIAKYKMHPSTLSIKKSVSWNNSTFKKVTMLQVIFDLHKINPKKAGILHRIPPKILKK